MLEDLHHSITDFWANSIPRNHGDSLGLGITRRRHIRNFRPYLHIARQAASVRGCSVSCPFLIALKSSASERLACKMMSCIIYTTPGPRPMNEQGLLHQ